MNDLSLFEHGEEGTHSVCEKHNVGYASSCCQCKKRTDCYDTLSITEKIEHIVRDFTTVVPFPKSEIRRRLNELVELAKQQQWFVK